VWLDRAGVPLVHPVTLGLAALDSTPLVARQGWIDLGIRFRSAEFPVAAAFLPIWVAIQGIPDTVRSPSEEKERPWIARSPNWTLDRLARPTEGWVPGASPIVLRVDPRSIRVVEDSAIWEKNHRRWRAAPSPAGPFGLVPRAFPGMDVSPDPTFASPPPRSGGARFWSSTPSPALPEAPLSIPGVGRARWTGRFRWIAPDTLLASADLVWSGSGRTTPATPIEIRVLLEEVQGHDVLRVPTPLEFRTYPSTGIEGPRGAYLSFDRRTLVLVRKGDRLVAAQDAWLTERGSEVDSHPVPASLILHRGGTLRALDAVLPLNPFAAPADTSTAPVLDRRKGIRFQVDRVSAVRTPLPRLDSAVWATDFGGSGGGRSRVVAAAPGSPDLVDADRSLPPLVGAAVLAWSEHRPLRFTPDAVWVALLDGLALRTRNAPEACRSEMVVHKHGKKAIEVALEGDPSSDPSAWTDVASRLIESMHRHVRRDRLRKLQLRFSTTTPHRALVQRLRLLEAWSPWFEYSGMITCAVPEVSLAGTPEDWRRIRSRLDALAVCGLGPWVERMKSVLDEFVRAAEGHPRRAFWQTMVRVLPEDAECGSSPELEGWIGWFHPVLDDGRWANFRDPIRFADLPAPVGSFDFTLGQAGGADKYRITSGFSGVAQEPDGTLRAELGWAVRQVLEDDASEE